MPQRGKGIKSGEVCEFMRKRQFGEEPMQGVAYGGAAGLLVGAAGLLVE